MKKMFGLVMIVFVISFLTGCATIANGSNQNIFVNSEPDSATIFVNNVQYGITPSTIPIDRDKESVVVTIEKQGYETNECVLNSSMNGWVFGNLLFGGIPGFLIDMIGGSAYEFSPDDINIILEPIEQNKKQINKKGEKIK